MKNKIDYTGQKFHRLTAIKFVKQGNRGEKWQFLCECGKKVVYTIKDVNRYDNKPIKSCGCMQKEHRQRIKSNNFSSYLTVKGIKEIQNIK